MSESPSTATSPRPSTKRPGVTVIPEEHGPVKWFEKNPVLTVAIAVAIVVLLVGFVFFWIRKRRRKAEASEKERTQKKDDDSGNVDSRPSQAETTISIPEFMFDPENRQSFSTTATRRPSNVDDFLGESFIIIGSPSNTNPRTQARRYNKKRKSLAMPPGFYVSNRRKSTPTIAPENELRPPRISFARWSTAGLEIHTPDMNPSRSSSISSDSKKLSVPNSSNGYVMKVPMVLRRVSQGQDHTIYATEPLPSSSTQSPNTRLDTVESDNGT